MLKTQPLCPGAELNLRERVSSEEETSGTGGHSRLLPPKTVCPNLGGSGEEFYSNGSIVGLLIRLECVQGLHPLTLSQSHDELLWFL